MKKRAKQGKRKLKEEEMKLRPRVGKTTATKNILQTEENKQSRNEEKINERNKGET